MAARLPRKATPVPGHGQQKLDYLHLNPVKAGLVRQPEHRQHSSTIDYAGAKGLVMCKLLAPETVG